MSLPRFSVQNHVLVNVLMCVILVAGMIFAFTLRREMFPESKPDQILVLVVYPGVEAEQIEKAVTIKIEEAVRDLSEIEKIESSVSENLSQTVLTLYNSVRNVDAVVQEVRNKIDALSDLPEDIESVTVEKLEPRLPVISVAVYGPADEATRKAAARAVRDDLLLLPGISDVELSGIRDDEISVEVRPDKLIEYDVTFQEVADAIRQTNLDVSGGELKGTRSNVTVRTLGEELRGEDLSDIVVRTTADGREVRLKDLATIRDGFVESDVESYFNGQPAAHCVVYKTREQDAIQISQLVKAYVYGKQGRPFDPYGLQAARRKPWYLRPFAVVWAQLGRTLSILSGRPDYQEYYERSRATPLPYNVQLALHTDLARFIEGRLDLMLRNGRNGLLLVLLSLILFLNWRVAFWAAVGLPVSFLGTFIVMWAFGATINLLSLFGLIIVLGIIVDDAIVIGENIYRHVDEGVPPLRAAVEGAEEVMWPVIVAVTTTIAAFAPLLFIRGQIGDFMRVLPIVVVSALSVSLTEALVILPAHLAGLPSKAVREGREGNRSGLVRLLDRLRIAQEYFVKNVLGGHYERFLRFALSWRYVTLSVATALLLASFGLFAGRIVRWQFIQKMDSETLICWVEMPVGTPADVVRQRLNDITQAVLKAPEVKNVQSYVALQIDFRGSGALAFKAQSHLGQLIVELLPADVREDRGMRSSEQLLRSFRQFSETLAGVNSIVWEALTGGPAGKDILARLRGKDYDELVQVARELKALLARYQGVHDLDDDYDPGKREVRLRLYDAARPTGLTVATLGRHVRGAFYGEEARRITRNREDVPIMVRYPRDFRSSLFNVESMWVPVPTRLGRHAWLPLPDVAQVDVTEANATIHRSQQERAVTVMAEVDRDVADPSEIIDQIRRQFDQTIQPRHPGVDLEFLGSYEEQTKSFASLKVAFPVALLLIYMLLAGLFRSYTQPVVVMSAIPFGFQGAILGHWLTGYPITILSLIGMVALTGIVVNDALVLVDFINKRVWRGMSHFEASVEGARLRLRPILLTTLTTVAGLLPIMFERSFQARFLIPMVVTLAFGLAFATVLTLVLVPCLNLVFLDVRDLALRALFGRARKPEPLEMATGGVSSSRPSA